MTWQPIETAPKDGTYVLLFGPDGIDLGKFRKWSFETSWTRPCTAEYDNELADITDPTHWMPLPPPPQVRSRSAYEEERGAILRWFDSQAKKYPRTDYAAWCLYFKAQIATNEYKDAEYWHAPQKD